MRKTPQRRKDKVYVGCGAGFGGDRPLAALKLLQRAEKLDYLVLECLAERTLADRYQSMISGEEGYDPRISEWMLVLLPLAAKRGVCIITNMGAVDPLGAQDKVIDVAKRLGLEITVSVAFEASPERTDAAFLHQQMKGASTYMGAAPIVYCLEQYKPNVVITSRVADAALFLAPMVYELGWNWDDYDQLAQGTLAGHLLECGCQLTGGYFMHPGDKYKSFSFEQLLNLSLPFAEIGYSGEVCVAKVNGSGGLLNSSTCAEQLLYEVADPASYITPDVVLDLRHVNFCPLSNDRVLCQGAKPSKVNFPDKLLQLVPLDCGWKGWGEISYGGHECLKRAEAADFLVRSWIDEMYPGIKDCIASYVIGHNSLKAVVSSSQPTDVRLRMDGLFKLKEHAVLFAREFTALYTNGPAGGGGISTGQKKEVILQKELVDRKDVFWQTGRKKVSFADSGGKIAGHDELVDLAQEVNEQYKVSATTSNKIDEEITPLEAAVAAPTGKNIPLYDVAHSRAGDKGNDLNFSIIPHFSADIEKLKKVITPEWVINAVSPLLDTSLHSDPRATKWNKNQLINVRVTIYEVPGIHSLNVVVQNILDGGVNCSRRIDRHGKTISDLILSQEIVLLHESVV